MSLQDYPPPLSQVHPPALETPPDRDAQRARQAQALAAVNAVKEDPEPLIPLLTEVRWLQKSLKSHGWAMNWWNTRDGWGVYAGCGVWQGIGSGMVGVCGGES